MRALAVILNVVLLGFVCYMLIKHGVPTGDEVFFAILVSAAPLASLIALWSAGGDDWLSLFLRRKALEERRKIEELDARRK